MVCGGTTARRGTTARSTTATNTPYIVTATRDAIEPVDAVANVTDGML